MHHILQQLQQLHMPNVFTRREVEIIQCLLKGWKNKQIALAIGISQRAVEYHVTNIMRKAEVRSRTEAVQWIRNQTEKL